MMAGVGIAPIAGGMGGTIFPEGTTALRVFVLDPETGGLLSAYNKGGRNLAFPGKTSSQLLAEEEESFFDDGSSYSYTIGGKEGAGDSPVAKPEVSVRRLANLLRDAFAGLPDDVRAASSSTALGLRAPSPADNDDDIAHDRDAKRMFERAIGLNGRNGAYMISGEDGGLVLNNGAHRGFSVITNPKDSISTVSEPDFYMPVSAFSGPIFVRDINDAIKKVYGKATGYKHPLSRFAVDNFMHGKGFKNDLSDEERRKLGGVRTPDSLGRKLAELAVDKSGILDGIGDSEIFRKILVNRIANRIGGYVPDPSLAGTRHGVWDRMGASSEESVAWRSVVIDRLVISIMRTLSGALHAHDIYGAPDDAKRVKILSVAVGGSRVVSNRDILEKGGPTSFRDFGPEAVVGHLVTGDELADAYMLLYGENAPIRLYWQDRESGLSGDEAWRRRLEPIFGPVDKISDEDMKVVYNGCRGDIERARRHRNIVSAIENGPGQ